MRKSQKLGRQSIRLNYNRRKILGEEFSLTHKAGAPFSSLTFRTEQQQLSENKINTWELFTISAAAVCSYKERVLAHLSAEKFGFRAHR